MAAPRFPVLLRLAALGLLLFVVGGTFLLDRPAEGEEEAGTSSAYVGTAVCLDCHKEHHARWEGTSHARTVEPATAQTMPPAVVAGDRAEHTPGWTQFHATGDGYLAETLGPDGKPTKYALSHVVGRMRVRMFLATMADGSMQVLPGMLEAPTSEWFDYTHLIFGAGGTDWGKAPIVNPGDPSFWTGPVRSWGAKCARCHVTGYEPVRPKGGTGPRMKFRELGVGCEMCHGPCGAHVEHREQGGQGTDPILRFEHLAHDRAVSLCLQCHMESEVVGSGFRFGDDIFEHRDPTLLIDPERVDPSGRPLELVYDGLPFSVSRCVQEGKLTCVTCHDPHGSGNPSQLKYAPDDDAMCTRCHEEIGRNLEAHTHHTPKSSGSRCVSCHMPFLSIERGHGVVADHSISTPRYDLKADRAAQVACTWCHQDGLGAPGDAPTMDEPALAKAHAGWYGDAAQAKPWMQALGAARLKEPDAHVALQQVVTDKGLPRIVRASAVRLLGRYGSKVPLALLGYARDEDSLVRRHAVASLASLEGKVVDEALLAATKDPSPAVQAAAAKAALEGWKRVQANRILLAAIEPILAREAEEMPGDEMRWFRLGAARSLLDDKRGALAAYTRQVELDPFAGYVKQEIARLKKELGQ
ncbi:MAG: cytochrome c3 family protein [Planctomycetota bacterium]|nr:cytochrome c3 family protein [Planctomycetota bacterium]